MTIEKFTQSSANLHTNASAAQEERELIIEIRPYDFERAVYFGSRAQLEAEGLMPEDIKWPSGRSARFWKRDGLNWTLHRVRPEGMKGPMRQWIEGDYWRVLSDSPTLTPPPAERERIQAECDMEDAARRLNPAYQLAMAVLSNKWDRAYHDRAYQQFRNKIPALQPKPRKSRATPAG